ncbi:MAG: hypothetical protein QOI31_763, partial [Solirubrobacterales bacterium]|nr:hypothetical protein [Solirubrobacterales bacterium]
MTARTHFQDELEGLERSALGGLELLAEVDAGGLGHAPALTDLP